MTLFKLYKNRKLYNTKLSQYATTQDLLTVALTGPVQVVTLEGQDMTAKALLSAVHEKAKHREYTVDEVMELAKAV